MNNEIRRKIREAQEQELKDNCGKIIADQTFNGHKHVGEITDKFERKSVAKRNNGRIIK